MGSRAGRAASTPSRHVGHPATRALTHAKVAWSPFSSTSSPTVGSIRRLQAAAFVRFTMRSRTSTASFRTATIRIARALLDSLEPSDDVDFLRELVAQELPAVQALHGDAHLGNCLQTTTESLWHDFETACRGPREYDLAALVMRHRQAAHGCAAGVRQARRGPRRGTPCVRCLDLCVVRGVVAAQAGTRRRIEGARRVVARARPLSATQAQPSHIPRDAPGARCQFSGPSRARTGGLQSATLTLSQLSYGPWSRFSVAPSSKSRAQLMPHA
jgi:hypothetical protein